MTDERTSNSFLIPWESCLTVRNQNYQQKISECFRCNPISILDCYGDKMNSIGFAFNNNNANWIAQSIYGFVATVFELCENIQCINYGYEKYGHQKSLGARSRRNIQMNPIIYTYLFSIWKMIMRESSLYIHFEGDVCPFQIAISHLFLFFSSLDNAYLHIFHVYISVCVCV